MIGILYLVYRKDSNSTKLELQRAKNYDLPIFREVMRDYGLEESIVEVLCQAHSNPNLDIYFAETPVDLGNTTRIARGLKGTLENDITYLMYDSRLAIARVQEFFASQYSGRPVSTSLGKVIQISYLLCDNDETFSVLSRNLPGDPKKQNVSIGTVQKGDLSITYTSQANIQADELYLDAKHERMLMKAAFETAKKYLDFEALSSFRFYRMYQWTKYYADNNALLSFTVEIVYDGQKENRSLQVPKTDLTDDLKIRELIEELFADIAEDLEEQDY